MNTTTTFWHWKTSWRNTFLWERRLRYQKHFILDSKSVKNSSSLGHRKRLGVFEKSRFDELHNAILLDEGDPHVRKKMMKMADKAVGIRMSEVIEEIKNAKKKGRRPRFKRKETVSSKRSKIRPESPAKPLEDGRNSQDMSNKDFVNQNLTYNSR